MGDKEKIAHKIGHTKYAMAEYDKIKRLTFPIDESHLLMMTKINSDHAKIITKVLELIKDSKIAKTTCFLSKESH